MPCKKLTGVHYIEIWLSFMGEGYLIKMRIMQGQHADSHSETLPSADLQFAETRKLKKKTP